MIYEKGSTPFPKPKDRKELERELRAAAKGSGWKIKQAVLFRRVEDWFVAVHHRNTPAEGGFHFSVEMLAKPMVLDEMYWKTMGLEENLKKPLSFRYWAAFACGTPVVAVRHIEAGDAVGTAKSIVEVANELLPDALGRLRTEKFSRIAENPLGIHDNFKMGPTIMFAQQLEENPEAALNTARELQETKKYHASVGSSVPDVKRAGKNIAEIFEQEHSGLEERREGKRQGIFHRIGSRLGLK